jgi:hypothetical protein
MMLTASVLATRQAFGRSASLTITNRQSGLASAYRLTKKPFQARDTAMRALYRTSISGTQRGFELFSK